MRVAWLHNREFHTQFLPKPKRAGNKVTPREARILRYGEVLEAGSGQQA
jgi:hypothetical protein